MTERIIKAHVLQFTEPSSKRLSSSLKESRVFLDYIEKSLSDAENSYAKLSQAIYDHRNSECYVSNFETESRSDGCSRSINALIEKRSISIEEFRRHHDDAERALERANEAIRERMSGFEVSKTSS